MIDQKPLIQLIGDIERVEEEFNKKAQEERIAKSAKNDAYSKLSDLQKQFDRVVTKMRSDAPNDSCWGHERKIQSVKV